MKKPLRIGINGLGRIGKLTLIAALENPQINIVAINDPFIKDLQYMKYLLKYDSVHPKLSKDIQTQDAKLIIDGHQIEVFRETDPANIPWGSLDVSVVAECSRDFLTQEKCQTHLINGAKKVIMSDLAKDKITPTYVFGINHQKYTSDQNIVSNASSAAHCLAPLAHIVNSKWGIEEGLITNVHPTTSIQNTVDAVNKKGINWRLGRSSLLNIIPVSTNSANAVGKIIPDLNGKLAGIAFIVPTVNVGYIDFTVKLNKAASYEQIAAEIKNVCETSMEGILGYTEDQVVSNDFIHESKTCIFDKRAGIQLNDKFMKLVAWYDNEWSYSKRILDLAEHIAKTSNLV